MVNYLFGKEEKKLLLPESVQKALSLERKKL
jgi:hypothetical protein